MNSDDRLFRNVAWGVCLMIVAALYIAYDLQSKRIDHEYKLKELELQNKCNK